MRPGYTWPTDGAAVLSLKHNYCRVTMITTWQSRHRVVMTTGRSCHLAIATTASRHWSLPAVCCSHLKRACTETAPENMPPLTRTEPPRLSSDKRMQTRWKWIISSTLTTTPHFSLLINVTQLLQANGLLTWSWVLVVSFLVANVWNVNAYRSLLISSLFLLAIF